jgi:hypothetical protein
VFRSLLNAINSFVFLSFVFLSSPDDNQLKTNLCQVRAVGLAGMLELLFGTIVRSRFDKRRNPGEQMLFARIYKRGSDDNHKRCVRFDEI